jgi:hypothetical protein
MLSLLAGAPRGLTPMSDQAYIGHMEGYDGVFGAQLKVAYS